MKKLVISFVLIFLSLNISAAISQSGITNLKQLDSNGIIGLIRGNQLTGFISDGPFQGPITHSYYKNGKYETIFDNKIYRGIWKVENKRLCSKKNTASNFNCVYWYTGSKDGGTYAYIIAQGKIFQQFHESKSLVQLKASRTDESTRIADSKKAEESTVIWLQSLKEKLEKLENLESNSFQLMDMTKSYESKSDRLINEIENNTNSQLSTLANYRDSLIDMNTKIAARIKYEESRFERYKKAEEKGIADAKKAEEKRIADAKKAEDKRKADAKTAEFWGKTAKGKKAEETISFELQKLKVNLNLIDIDSIGNLATETYYDTLAKADKLIREIDNNPYYDERTFNLFLERLVEINSEIYAEQKRIDKEKTKADPKRAEEKGIEEEKGETKYEYCSNGQIEEEKNYKDGKLHGKWNRWNCYRRDDSNYGYKIDEFNFKDGIIDGKQFEFFRGETDQIYKEMNYKDGKKHGKYILWQQDGKYFLKEGHWSNGKYIDTVYFNGMKKIEGNFKDDERDGKWTTWHPSGKKESEGYYKRGKRHGTFTSWETNGWMNPKTNWKDGICTDFNCN